MNLKLRLVFICVVVFSIVFLFGNSISAQFSDRYEISFSYGFYYPPFKNTNPQSSYIKNLRGTGPTMGFSFFYPIRPYVHLCLQTDFFQAQSEPAEPYFDDSIRMQVTRISLLLLLNFIESQRYRVYGGGGLADQKINSTQPGVPDKDTPTTLSQPFGYPWITTVLLGLAISPKEFYQIKAEIQYFGGEDGKLYKTPLEWDGFKIAFGIGLRF